MSTAAPERCIDTESHYDSEERGDMPQEIQSVVIPSILDLPQAYFQRVPSNLIGAIRARIKLHAGSQHGTDAQILLVLEAAKSRFTAEFAKEIQPIIDRMRCNLLPAGIDKVREEVQEVLTFSSEDVRAIYTEIDRADHNNFTQDPDFLIFRIECACTRNFDRKPTLAEVREVVEALRPRFAPNFSTTIDSLLQAYSPDSLLQAYSPRSSDRHAESSALRGTLPTKALPHVFSSASTADPSTITPTSSLVSFDFTPGFIESSKKLQHLKHVIRNVRIEFFTAHKKAATSEEVLSLLHILWNKKGLSLKAAALMKDNKKVRAKIDEVFESSAPRDKSDDANNAKGSMTYNAGIDFHFDVDPDVDLAIATELSLDEAEGEFEIEDFASLGIDPFNPTDARPGSEEKVRVLAARYAAGVPLWNENDRYDHSSNKGGDTDVSDGDQEIDLDEIDAVPEEEL